MARKRALTEAEALEQYRVALENVESQPEIAAIMAEFGYNETLLAEGKALFTKTREAYDFNKKEDDETSESYQIFSTLKEELAKKYILHRKKAKVIFRKDAVTSNKLSISSSLPKAYINWLETIKKFYTVALASTEIQTKLSRLNLSPEELNETMQSIANLEQARSAYLREKGESQDATKLKDKVFGEMDEWMYEFYAVAKIALEDNLQLLESLGKHVKS